MLAVVGNCLTVLGLGLTLWAFIEEHRSRGLGDLFPPVTRTRSRVVGYVRRVTGRTRTHRVTATIATSWDVAAPITPMVWKHVAETDTVDQRVEKVNANLEELRALVERSREHDTGSFTRRANKIHDELRALRAQVEEGQRLDHQVSTRAMSRQIVGLLVAGVGSLLSALG